MKTRVETTGGVRKKQLGWSAKRELAKINYHIHMSAVSHNLIPPWFTASQKSFVYRVKITS